MNHNISLTILTPTYNRGYRLIELYNSLKSQTSLDFKWLIIDDGSTDNTGLIVHEMSSSSRFDITYLYKKNGGKHTALNSGFDFIDSDLTFIVDSDDKISLDAVESIRKDWLNHQDNDLIGLMYLKAYSNNSIIGDEFVFENKITTYIQSRLVQKVKGDKAEVWKTSILKDNKFPEFLGENFFSEQYVYIQLSNFGNVIPINKVIYYCEYLKDGLSKNIRFLQAKNPNGALLNAITLTKKEYGFIRRYKSGIQITIFSILANKNPFFKLYDCGFRLTIPFLFAIGYTISVLYRFLYLNKK